MDDSAFQRRWTGPFGLESAKPAAALAPHPPSQHTKPPLPTGGSPRNGVSGAGSGHASAEAAATASATLAPSASARAQAQAGPRPVATPVPVPTPVGVPPNGSPGHYEGFPPAGDRRAQNATPRARLNPNSTGAESAAAASAGANDTDSKNNADKGEESFYSLSRVDFYSYDDEEEEGSDYEGEEENLSRRAVSASQGVQGLQATETQPMAGGRQRRGSAPPTGESISTAESSSGGGSGGGSTTRRTRRTSRPGSRGNNNNSNMTSPKAPDSVGSNGNRRLPRRGSQPTGLSIDSPDAVLKSPIETANTNNNSAEGELGSSSRRRRRSSQPESSPTKHAAAAASGQRRTSRPTSRNGPDGGALTPFGEGGEGLGFAGAVGPYHIPECLSPSGGKKGNNNNNNNLSGTRRTSDDSNSNNNSLSGTRRRRSANPTPLNSVDVNHSRHDHFYNRRLTSPPPGEAQSAAAKADGRRSTTPALSSGALTANNTTNDKEKTNGTTAAASAAAEGKKGDKNYSVYYTNNLSPRKLSDQERQRRASAAGATDSAAPAPSSESGSPANSLPQVSMSPTNANKAAREENASPRANGVRGSSASGGSLPAISDESTPRAGGAQKTAADPAAVPSVNPHSAETTTSTAAGAPARVDYNPLARAAAAAGATGVPIANGSGASPARHARSSPSPLPAVSGGEDRSSGRVRQSGSPGTSSTSNAFRKAFPNGMPVTETAGSSASPARAARHSSGLSTGSRVSSLRSTDSGASGPRRRLVRTTNMTRGQWGSTANRFKNHLMKLFNTGNARSASPRPQQNGYNARDGFVGGGVNNGRYPGATPTAARPAGVPMTTTTATTAKGTPKFPKKKEMPTGDPIFDEGGPDESFAHRQRRCRKLVRRRQTTATSYIDFEVQYSYDGTRNRYYEPCPDIYDGPLTEEATYSSTNADAFGEELGRVLTDAAVVKTPPSKYL